MVFNDLNPHFCLCIHAIIIELINISACFILYAQYDRFIYCNDVYLVNNLINPFSSGVCRVLLLVVVMLRSIVSRSMGWDSKESG